MVNTFGGTRRRILTRFANRALMPVIHRFENYEIILLQNQLYHIMCILYYFIYQGQGTYIFAIFKELLHKVDQRKISLKYFSEIYGDYT